MIPKSLIFYAYFESPSAVRNLSFFMDQGLLKGVDNIKSVLIINGKECSINENDLNNKWDLILRRDNLNMDFGAWSHAINLLQNELDNYDRYFFINSSVIGPFFPTWVRFDTKFEWIRIFSELITDKIKLAGLSINIYSGKYFSEIKKFKQKKIGGLTIDYSNSILPHVQSMFLVIDKVGLNIALKNGIFNLDSNIYSKYELIAYKELALSHMILEFGYDIDCILSNYSSKNYHSLEIRHLNIDRGGFPWVENGYLGRTIHPYESIFFKTTNYTDYKVLNELIQEKMIY